MCVFMLFFSFSELGVVDGCRVYAESRLSRSDPEFAAVDWDHLNAADESEQKKM